MGDIRTEVGHRGPEFVPDPAVGIEVVVFVRTCPVHCRHECEIIVEMRTHRPVEEFSDLGKNGAWTFYEVLEYGDLAGMYVAVCGYGACEVHVEDVVGSVVVGRRRQEEAFATQDVRASDAV